MSDNCPRCGANRFMWSATRILYACNTEEDGDVVRQSSICRTAELTQIVAELLPAAKQGLFWSTSVSAYYARAAEWEQSINRAEKALEGVVK